MDRWDKKRFKNTGVVITGKIESKTEMIGEQ